MRIGLDCRTILNPGSGEHAGVGHYTYYLVKNLLEIDSQNEYILFFDRRVIETQELEKKNVRLKFFPFSQYRRYLPFAYSHMLISSLLEREKLDLYHSPANVIPLMYQGASVITVHDLAVYKHPEWFPSQYLSRRVFSTKILVPKSLEKAKKIIAVSEHTKKDIMKLFKVPEKKIQVIYEGVAQEKEPTIEEIKGVLEKFNLGERYILFLGTIEPRKNIVNLIKAFKNLGGSGKNISGNFSKYQLVIAGIRGWKDKNVFEAIKKFNKNDRIRYLGYVMHSDKLALIKGAACFVFPTFYEGFGLPVLEAMALGAPVVTSNSSSLPEITGQAAILINPRKINELVSALKKILKNKNLRMKLAQEGKKQARKFSWTKTVRETLKVYKQAVEK